MNATSKSTEHKATPTLVIRIKESKKRVVLDTTPGKSVIIGRDKDCDIPIPEAAGVSRQHCKITTVGMAFMLQDLGSTNGTFENAEAIQAAVPLKEGFTYTIGDATLKIIGLAQKTKNSSSKPKQAQKKYSGSRLIIKKRGPLAQALLYVKKMLNPITNNKNAPKVNPLEIFFVLVLTFYIGLALYNYTHGGSILPPFLD